MANKAKDLQLTIAVLIVVLALHLTSAQDPEIVFQSQYHVVFPGPYLSRFHRCLCNEDKKSCTAEYRLDRSLYEYGYRVEDVDDEDIEDTESKDTYGSVYQCEPGSFGIEGAITCTKQRHDATGCVFDGIFTPHSNAPCRSFRVPTTHSRCDVSCVDIYWLGFYVEYENYPSAQVPQLGLCDGSTPPTETATTSVITTPDIATQTVSLPQGGTPTTAAARQSSSLAPGGAVSMKDEGGGGGSSSVALGAGIGCALIGLLVCASVAAIILWRRRRKRAASMNKPALPYIPHLHASNTYSTARYDGGSGKQTDSAHEYSPAIENGSEYAAYLEPVHVYSCAADEDASASAVYSNIDDFSQSNGKNKSPPAPPLSSPGAVAPTFPKGGQQHDGNQGQYDVAVALTVPEHGKKRKKKSGVLGFGKKEKAEDGKSGGEGDAPHNYNRLHAGRAGKPQEVSRSVLARYNNPPSQPSAPPEVDSLYEAYEEELAGADNHGIESSPDTPNAYSMAGPIPDGETGEQAVAGPPSPPYENTHTGGPAGIVNLAFSPRDSELSSHHYADLDDYADITEETEPRADVQNTQNASRSAGKTVYANDTDAPANDTRPANDYFELEKDTYG